MTISKKEQHDLINEITEAVNNIGWALTRIENRAATQSLAIQ